MFYSSAHQYYFLFPASGQDLSITCNKKSLAMQSFIANIVSSAALLCYVIVSQADDR